MNLAIDFGNTFTKAGFFERDTLNKVVKNLKEDDLRSLINSYAPDEIIVSAVTKNVDDFVESIKGRTKRVMVLRHDLPLPFEIRYKTPESLGVDRIAAVAGAQGIFPKKNCLVIDTGTCFTYDLLDSEGVYHGGGISPGLRMRFQAMHNFTANLPLINFEEDPPLIGQTTASAIQSGVVNGATAEITEIIRMYSDKFANLQIIMCGGDTGFFEKRLKASIFAAPELVLRGLNRILLYNA